ncbi:MAG: GTPase Era [Pseudomonadota bacterium]
MPNDLHCGYVAIIGRPNMGKSTLLNKLLGQKVSITSRKPQTTRNRILGIKTKDNIQTIYIDTPGIHDHSKQALNKIMNRAALSTLFDVNVIIFLVEAQGWTEQDDFVWQKLENVQCPIILLLNKVDLIKDKARLLPLIDALHEKHPGQEIIPISALTGDNLEHLEKSISQHLPVAAHLFAADQVTDNSDEFIISEIIREKILRLTGQEVPHKAAVKVESMKMEKNILHIQANIFVERKGQKAIIIGKQGAKLKEIGTTARLDLEKVFNCKVFLGLWVKVETGWSDDESVIGRLM